MNGSLLSIGKFIRHSACYPCKGSITACRPEKEQILIVIYSYCYKKYTLIVRKTYYYDNIIINLKMQQ